MLSEVVIEITQRCPNMCIYCSSMSHINCKEQICYGKVVEVISDLKELGVNQICLSGGEPLLHESILDIARFIVGIGMDCVIYTSGIVIDKQDRYCSIPKDMLKLLALIGVKIIFNIEAHEEETYNKIMGTNGCFPLMQESVRRAVDVGLTVESNFVPNVLNFRDIPQVITFCNELGVSKINFLKLVVHGRAEEHKLELEIPNYGSLIDIFNSLNVGNMQIRIGAPLLELIDSSCVQCEAARGKLSIDYKGDVYPCEVFKNKHSFCGYKPDSIYNLSIIDIYNNSPYLKFVKYSNPCKRVKCVLVSI